MRYFIPVFCILLLTSCASTRKVDQFGDARVIEQQRAEIQHLKSRLDDIRGLADTSTIRAGEAAGRLDVLETILDECFRRLKAIYRTSDDTRSNERADSDKDAAEG